MKIELKKNTLQKKAWTCDCTGFKIWFNSGICEGDDEPSGSMTFYRLFKEEPIILGK